MPGWPTVSPCWRLSIAIGLFSLAGLPIFVGFTAKFYLFTAVAEAGFLWLAGLAIFTSLVSLYYYLQVVRQMYIQPALAAGGHPEHDVDGESPEAGHGAGHDAHGGHGDGEPAVLPLARPSPLLLAVLVAGLVAALGLGVYPAPVLDLVETASRAILPFAPVP